MLNLQDVGRLPAPDDNCAIAVRTLAAGTAIQSTSIHFTLSHTVLEGHRFAVRAIPAGASLLSWGMPFGRALRDIHPGEYICNAAILAALSGRGLDFDLPQNPNFIDDFAPFQFQADRFQPAAPLPQKVDKRTFLGFRRPGQRGSGTRNMIVLLAVNALVAGFARHLEQATKPLASRYENIDGIVAVAHTEGGQTGSNNEELLLRTLAGFMVHPNVGAVLLLDAGDSGVNNAMLRAYADRHGYPLSAVLHGFLSLRGPFDADVKRGAAIIEGWLRQVNGVERSPQPLSELKIALQCGGSDAFSGISGNPLAAWVSKEVVQAGGTAVLAETDELFGAEAYLLQKVRDAATVQKFLEFSTQFKNQAAWHGHSAHGNVSGGNLFRGLYNIYLKSLGAAIKRHPDVRLDEVIAYGERLGRPGYYFMDSPGNDLESIAGQVAAGCNLIYFVTGNGSITNFPFVPTIKIVTTSERYALLPDEMDVNAGLYLEGMALSDLGQETMDLSLAVASGQPSAGELAQHAQVQIWRNWPLTDFGAIEPLKAQPEPDGKPLLIPPPKQLIDINYTAWQTESGVVSDRVGLILPSSLCSAQIAGMAAQMLNKAAVGTAEEVSGFAALMHTEGCGNSTEPEYVDTMLGYLSHPMAATSLLLEHGCEKTHNDFWRQRMLERGLDPAQFGWASVQMDGGIRRTLAAIKAWFTADCAKLTVPREVTAGIGNARIGMMTEGKVDEQTAVSLAEITKQIVAAGGTVMMPDDDPLAVHDAFVGALQMASQEPPTLAYARQPAQPGFHLMANVGSQWLETLTGLGATGVALVLALVTEGSRPSHPFIPVLQVVAEADNSCPYDADMDLILQGTAQKRLNQLAASISAVLSRKVKPKLSQKGHTDFQVTRGRLGVSL